MKKNYFKQILSTLLVLCMMAAFIPAAFAADTAEETKTGIKVVYDFTDYEAGTPLQAITYENSGGKMEFFKETDDETADSVDDNGNALVNLNAAKNYIAFKIKIPKQAIYEVKATWCYPGGTLGGSTQMNISFVSPTDKPNYDPRYQYGRHFFAIDTSKTANPDAEKGDPKTETATRRLYTVPVTEIPALENDGTTTPFKYYAEQDEIYLSVCRYTTRSGEERAFRLKSIELLEVNPETGEAYENLVDYSFENEVELVSQNVFMLSTVLGDEANSSSDAKSINIVDGYATVSADEKDADGNTFLYWVKGLQSGVGVKVLSTQRENYKFKPSNGNNYIIAVYGKPSGYTPKYFNANGEPLPNGTEEVSMPGYGSTSKFKDCGFGVYIADYDEANEETYTITVNGKNMSGEAVETTKTPKFGEAVTVTTAASYESDRTYCFLCWKRTANGVTEVVSFDSEYTFSAFENCELTAMYVRNNDYATAGKAAFRKIILTNLSGNQYMAEFIGFGDAVEKGIAIGTKKIAMTTDKTMFTLDAETTEGVKGYAIDKEGKVYYAD